MTDLSGRPLPEYIDVFSRRYKELNAAVIAGDTGDPFPELFRELRQLLETHVEGLPFELLEPVASNVNEVNTVEHALLPLLEMREKAATLPLEEDRDTRMRHWENMLRLEMDRFLDGIPRQRIDRGDPS